MNKIRNKNGETFVETLIAFMILTLVITGFCGIISSTAKLNKQVKDMRVSFNEAEKTEVAKVTNSSDDKWTIKIDGKNYYHSSKLAVYTDDGEDLYYYEYN